MCKYCEDFRKHNYLILRLRNGGIDPRVVLALTIRRENQKKNSDAYLAVEEHHPGEPKDKILMQTSEPIVFCPFCGERL